MRDQKGGLIKNKMFISFSHPFNFIFLFVIPLIIFLHFFGLKSMRGKALGFANFEAIARIKGIDLYSKNISILLFDILFVVLLVFSISGMTLHKEMEASTFSFAIAIDASESMSAKDMVPDRISVAKETAINFIETSPYETPTLIISFSGNSYIEQELTKEKRSLKNAINNIEISNVKGTDIHEAVLVSSNLLKDEKSKAIILLSDGQINTGDLDQVIDYAKFNDILIHTIAIGTVEGGEASFGISKLDEEILKALAYNTNGKFFNVLNKEELQDSFNEIRQVTRRMGSIDLSFYLVLSLMGLFIFRRFLVSLNKIIW